jgi:hypothetical protein
VSAILSNRPGDQHSELSAIFLDLALEVRDTGVACAESGLITTERLQSQE